MADEMLHYLNIMNKELTPRMMVLAWCGDAYRGLSTLLDMVGGDQLLIGKMVGYNIHVPVYTHHKPLYLAK